MTDHPTKKMRPVECQPLDFSREALLSERVSISMTREPNSRLKVDVTATPVSCRGRKTETCVPVVSVITSLAEDRVKTDSSTIISAGAR